MVENLKIISQIKIPQYLIKQKLTQFVQYQANQAVLELSNKASEDHNEAGGHEPIQLKVNPTTRHPTV